jgi:predicted outer membrane protein
MLATFSRAAVVGALAVAFFSVAGAQEVQQKADPAEAGGAIVLDPTPHPTGVLSPERNDRRIVRWLAVDHEGLMECAKFAANHSTNDAVKQFAREIAAEHETFHHQFTAVDRKQPDDKRPTADARPQQGATAALIRDDGKSRAGELVYRPTDFVAVKERICKDLQKIALKEMESIKGPEFDHAFLAHMVFGHQALIASVDALDDDAGDALQPKLVALREMLDRHLTRARELNGQVRAQTAGRPATTEVK